jgi:hypothetical protein
LLLQENGKTLHSFKTSVVWYSRMLERWDSITSRFEVSGWTLRPQLDSPRRPARAWARPATFRMGCWSSFLATNWMEHKADSWPHIRRAETQNAWILTSTFLNVSRIRCLRQLQCVYFQRKGAVIFQHLTQSEFTQVLLCHSSVTL